MFTEEGAPVVQHCVSNLTFYGEKLRTYQIISNNISETKVNQKRNAWKERGKTTRHKIA